jgi:hypothetical protein
MTSCNPSLVYDPAVKSNPAISAYRHLGEIRAAPPSFYDGELSAFDPILTPLMPANVLVEDPDEQYLLMANRSQSLGHGFGSYPTGWTSSPYPGMSTGEYNFIRRRGHSFSTAAPSKIYESDNLWGTRFSTQGPWTVPGVTPATQSNAITPAMINEARGFPAHCE